jgi:RNA polymerase sigma-70 factor (ECF subfamily)
MRRRRLRLGQGGTPSGFARARADPAAFADVYLEHHDHVLRYFARRTFDPETAFDLMAETFAELFAHIGEFRGETDEQGRAWMWSVARTRLWRWRERGIVERRCLESLGMPVAALGPAEYERIEELADLRRLAPVLERALEGLGADQRAALRARFLEHREYEDIAAEQGVTAQVVRARVSRGLRQLAQLLDGAEAVAPEPPAAPARAASRPAA